MKDLVFIVLTAVLILAYGFLRSQPDVVDESTLEFVWVAVLISLSLIFVRVISYLLVDVLFTRIQRKQPSDLLRLIVSLLLYGTSAVLIFRSLGQDIGVLLTTSALLTAIIGFALQATLGNLFGGVAMQIEQPFQIGDWIQLEDIFGRIEALRWRSIVIRKPTNALMVVPNNRMSRMEVEVFPVGTPVRSDIEFPAALTVSPQKIRNIVDEVIRGVPHVSRAKAPFLRAVEFDNEKGSVVYRIGYFLEDFGLKNATDALILERVWYALSRNHIEIPTPIFYNGADIPWPIVQYDTEYAMPARDNMEIILANSLFETLTPEETKFLTGSIVKHLFAPGERIIFTNESDCSMFVISQGSLNAQIIDSTAMVDFFGRAEQARNGHDTFLPQWDPNALEDITTRFTLYLGPIAGILVERAAQQTACLYRLHRILVKEISDPADRSAFLAGSPPYPIKHMQVGDYFGVMSLFLGKARPQNKMEAVSETELLEIRVPLIKELLSNNNKLAADFSHQLAKQLANQFQGTDLSPNEFDETSILEQMNEFYGVKTL